MLTTNCRFPRLIKVGLRLWPTFVLFDTRLREWVTPAFGAIVVAALVRQASIASEQQTRSLRLAPSTGLLVRPRQQLPQPLSATACPVAACVEDATLPLVIPLPLTLPLGGLFADATMPLIAQVVLAPVAPSLRLSLISWCPL